MGQQPLTSQELTKAYKGTSQPGYKFVKGWNEELDKTRSYLTKAGKCMKKWEDKKRQPRKFIMSDKANADGKGLIDYNEFKTTMMKFWALHKEEHFLKAFQRFDKDNK
uniref:EF-hand domain-containing protein n=1 Tax=Lactuca sativa TaxID=4236 RepID=A0A9R1UIB7_LACSA|nr:hypothetical protein LSAT_V11C900493820 [Lactuca sativa]